MHIIQRDEITQVGPSFEAFVGEGRMTIFGNEALGINLFPEQNEFILGFEKEKVSTTDKFVISRLGQIYILGVMTLWVALETNDDDELHTITVYEIDGAIKRKWYLVDIDCKIILGWKSMRELELNLEYPYQYSVF